MRTKADNHNELIGKMVTVNYSYTQFNYTTRKLEKVTGTATAKVFDTIPGYVAINDPHMDRRITSQWHRLANITIN